MWKYVLKISVTFATLNFLAIQFTILWKNTWIQMLLSYNPSNAVFNTGLIKQYNYQAWILTPDIRQCPEKVKLSPAWS